MVAGGAGSMEEERGSDGQVGERKEKKGKENGLLHWASVWARKWRWEMGLGRRKWA